MNELLAAIYDAPDDDAPRAVNADWLQERGDPLGELIALQLAPSTPASLRRQATLIRRHAQPWLGAVWHVVNQKRLHFARGFIAEARLVKRVSPSSVNVAVGDPRWATLRTLDVEGFPYNGEVLVLHDVLRGLRTLLAAPPEVARAILTDERPRRIETLEIADEVPQHSALCDAVRAAAALPNLRHLGIFGRYGAGPEQLDWLWDSPLGGRLGSVSLKHVSPSPAWRTSTAIPANITAVYFGQGPLDITTLRRGPSGLLDQLEEPAR